MNGRTALTLVVAVVAGSVQVDWNGRTVKLSAGQQQAFAAEGSDRGVEGRRVQADGDKAKPSNKMVIVAVHKIVGGKAFLESFDGKTYEVVGKTAASLARMPKEILFLEATLVKEQPNGGTVELGVWGTSPLNKDAKKLQLKYLDQIIEKRKAMGLFINQKTYDKLKKEKKAMGL